MVGPISKAGRIIILWLGPIAAGLAVVADLAGHRPAFLLLKPLATLLFMLPLFFVSGGTDLLLSRFKMGMLTGLAFCLLGDVFLMYQGYFVHGLASFLAGHLLFAFSFIGLKGFSPHKGSFLLIFGTGAAIFLWLRPDLGSFMLPVALYVLVISFMAWQGLGLYIREPIRAFGWIALGALFFMFSDTLIAISKFKAPFYLSGTLVLGTYWLSLGLLTHATGRLVSRG